MKITQDSYKPVDEIMNVFHHKKSLDAPAGFTEAVLKRSAQRPAIPFYLPAALKIAAAVMLLVLNTYTIYFFTIHPIHASAPTASSALIRFYQPADTSVDFAYQLIRNK